VLFYRLTKISHTAPTISQFNDLPTQKLADIVGASVIILLLGNFVGQYHGPKKSADQSLQCVKNFMVR